MLINDGLKGVVAGDTRISSQSPSGGLSYRGYDIHDLVSNCSFEEVAYLLWYGNLPSVKQLRNLKERLSDFQLLPKLAVAFLSRLPRSMHPIQVLRTCVSAVEPQRRTTSIADALKLTALMPTIVCSFHRKREGKKTLDSQLGLSHAANYLYMLHGRIPDQLESTALDNYLVLMAEHGMNASSFAMSVAASTGSDMYSSVVAAISTFAGPLHGGAPEKVMSMLNSLRKATSVRSWIRATLKHRQPLMGFGHRIYRTDDPRAVILKNLTREMANPKTYELACAVEDTANDLLEKIGLSRRPYVNVELYAAVLLDSLGIPRDMYSSIASSSRVAGWTSHFLEQMTRNRLIRPDLHYVGSERRFAR